MDTGGERGEENKQDKKGKRQEVDELNGCAPEDVAWLSSLSESELDMLISLKKLAIQRAKVIGHEKLADKFDLKMLRALGGMLLEYMKERAKDSSIFSNPEEASKFLQGCNLLASNRGGDFSSMAIDDIKASIRVKRKRKE
ncbi:hypothetical protein ACLOJK_020004 [Asimina triloba]